MEIKVIGSNTSDGLKLFKTLKRVINMYQFETKIELIADHGSIKKHKIKNVPGLIVNDKVVSEGYVPSIRELEDILLAV